MDWIQIYLAVFVLCFSMTLVFTPLCRRLAILTNCMDMPKSEQHKLHGNATPLLGGLAMFSAWILTILLSIAATRFLDLICDNRTSPSGGPRRPVTRDTILLFYHPAAALSNLFSRRRTPGV